jgi:hypothetical protein
MNHDLISSLQVTELARAKIWHVLCEMLRALDPDGSLLTAYRQEAPDDPITIVLGWPFTEVTIGGHPIGDIETYLLLDETVGVDDLPGVEVLPPAPDRIPDDWPAQN